MYAKVFASLWDGTLGRNWEAWSVFVYLLANCDRHGVIDVMPEAIADRSHIPLEAVEKGLRALEQPDRRSRSDTEGGRRIVPLDEHRDWGWRIVNYEYYRTVTDADMVRQQTRDRVRRHRQLVANQREKRSVTVGNARKRHAEAEAEAEERKNTPPQLAVAGEGGLLSREWREAFDAHFWPAYPRHLEKRDALKAWDRIRPKNATRDQLENLLSDILTGVAWWRRTEWDERPKDKVPYPATWLNKGVWTDGTETEK